MLYRITKCPHCGYSLEFLNPDWTAFGDPRTPCPQCAKTIVFTNVVEWEVRTPGERRLLILAYYVWGNLCMAFGGAMAFFFVSFLVFWLFNTTANRVFGSGSLEPLFLGVYAMSFVVIGIYRHFEFVSMIKDSRARTADPDYLKRMKELRRQFEERSPLVFPTKPPLKAAPPAPGIVLNPAGEVGSKSNQRKCAKCLQDVEPGRNAKYCYGCGSLLI